MRILIDGYNYLHAVGLLRARIGTHAGPHELERARKHLLGELDAACADDDVTVVFDAANFVDLDPTADKRHSRIHILFEKRRTADDLIEDLIHRDTGPKHLTVVSNDHRVRDAAVQRGCTVCKCEEFAELLVQRRRKTPPTPPPQEEKPNAMSDDETQEWVRRFGGAV